MTTAEVALDSKEGRHRQRVRRRVKLWVTRPLMAALIVAQLWASFGTHGLGVWAFGASAWWEAWIPVLLIDVTVFITAHAATAGMLPTKDQDTTGLRRLAWTLALVGFAMAIAAQVANRHVSGPAGQTFAQTVIADALSGAPVIVVLVCLVFRGKLEDWVERLTQADDEEIAAENARARAREERAERERRKAAERESGNPSRESAPAGSGVGGTRTAETVAAGAGTASHESDAGGTGETPATGDKASANDAYILTAWKGGRAPTGSEVDKAMGKPGSTYGRKRIALLSTGKRLLDQARATGHEPSADELEEGIKAAGHAQVTGAGARLLDAFPPDEGESEPETAQGPYAVPDAAESETTGERARETAA